MPSRWLTLPVTSARFAATYRIGRRQPRHCRIPFGVWHSSELSARISSRWSALSDPKPSAYRPHVAARRPGGGPKAQPLFRGLVHRQFLDTWNSLAERVGLENAQQFWDHVAFTPGEHPRVGTSSVMMGKHNSPKWPGYSKTIHYEISGAGRIDYQYNQASTEGAHREIHGCCQDPDNRSRESLTRPRQPSVFLSTFCQPASTCRGTKTAQPAPKKRAKVSQQLVAVILSPCQIRIPESCRLRQKLQ